MGKVTSKIDSNSDIELIRSQVDYALGSMAEDIEMIAAYKVPVDTGRLARFIRKVRLSWKKWQITVNLPYAEYQERGSRADGTYKVRNYSRAGSGPHFFRDAIQIVSSRATQYFAKSSRITKPTKFTSGDKFS